MVLTGHWHQIPGWKLFWIGCWFVVLLQFNKLFLLFLLLFGNEFMCQRSLFLLGDNKHFFLSFKYRSCLLDLLAFFSFRFDGVYFKVEKSFLLSKCWEIWQEKKVLLFVFSLISFFLEANFDFWIFFWFRFFFYAACIKCSLMCSCSLFFLCLIFVVEIWICFVFFLVYF